MATSTSRHGRLVLLSASLLCVVLGSVHAFSVFLEPLETRFGATRSLVSATYSLALVSLTFAVLLGHRVFSRMSAAGLIIAVCLAAACGALMAAMAPSLPIVWIGYSLIFGAANGLGYAFGLQIAAQANPGHEGRSMGIVTACYALGASVSPVLFSWGLAAGGVRTAMLGLSAALLVIAPLCAVLMIKAKAVFHGSPAEQEKISIPVRSVALLWLGYGFGVAAGLMTIGHATGIAKQAGITGALWIAPMFVATCNMLGSFAGGWLVDRTSILKLLVGLPLISASALGLLGVAGADDLALLGLGLVGLTYGAIIAVYPAVIAKLFGLNDGPRIYGRVFTAWGAAGLIAPWFAGHLFDQTGGYTVALMTAAALSSASAFFSFLMFRENRERVIS